MTSCIPVVICLAIYGAPTVTATSQSAARSIYENAAPATPNCEIDRIVFRKLDTLGIHPKLCSDAVFIRRVYLDVIGTLPTAKEVREFLEDRDAKTKRQRLIDRLLERDEFADCCALKWGDILRIKAEFPVNLWPNAAQAYHRWVHASIVQNKPYDQMVREMLTSSGSNFRVGPVNFYRAVQNKTPDGLAGAVALTFMGVRVDAWPKEKLDGMSAFFSQVGYKATNEWKEEIVFWDPYHCSETECNTAVGQDSLEKLFATGGTASKTQPQLAIKRMTAVFPDGTKVELTGRRDPREIFADWLIRPENPWFTRCVANRIWSWLLGRGVINEPDDIRPDNPPSNPELLDCLEREMFTGRYDLKRFYRLILNSNVYQLSSVPRFNSPKAEANFASYSLRRLDAEVLIDAINKVTGTADLYTSAIPEPFTYIPKDMPAIAIADGSITSSFLTLFGRSARATGMENERINKPLPMQWLHMLNSSHIQEKIEQGPALRAIINSGRKPREIAEELYLTILSRFPTEQELEVVESYSIAAATAAKSASAPATVQKPAAGKQKELNGKRGAAKKAMAVNKAVQTPAKPRVFPKTQADWLDIAWALINSDEFLYRH